MNQTDLKLKLALSNELPGFIEIQEFAYDERKGYQPPPDIFWKDDRKYISEREWDWVVNKCCELLNAAQKQQFAEILAADNGMIDVGYYPGDETPAWDNIADVVLSTWQERATAYFKTVGKPIE